MYLGAKRRYINTLPFLSFPLLKVMNNFLRAAEPGRVSVLCLLDLSAAFDTLIISCYLRGNNVVLAWSARH